MIDEKQLTKLLYYFSSFDGGVYKRYTNASFIMNMRKENLDYVKFVSSILNEFTSSRIVDRKDYNTDNYNRKPQVRLCSRVHPKLTKIWENIYNNGRKVLTPHMLKFMDEECLAIIFMADGASDPSSGIRLFTCGYSYFENLALSKCIYEKLGIRSTVGKHGKYWMIRISSKDIPVFVNMVKPYIAPSFRYKIERLTPRKDVDDEIVWPEWEHSERVRNTPSPLLEG